MHDDVTTDDDNELWMPHVSRHQMLQCFEAHNNRNRHDDDDKNDDIYITIDHRRHHDHPSITINNDNNMPIPEKSRTESIFYDDNLC